MKAMQAALLVVDVQNDFCPGGALPVSRGDRVVAPINAYLAQALASGMVVYMTRDWHPPVTTHFKERGGAWPPHCIQGTPGAMFHPGLNVPSGSLLVSKGDAPDSDGYSAFDGHTTDGTPLLLDMRSRGITHVYLAGLATDYCIRHSARAARDAGLRVTVLADAIAGVDLEPGDSGRALDEMRARGVLFDSGPDALKG